MRRLPCPGTGTTSSRMSHFWIPIQVAVRGGDFSEPLQALVDTGSTYTWIPGDLLAALGVAPQQQRPFVLADGREAMYGVGWIDIRLEGREQPTIVVFAPPGAEPILGVVTLEEFGLAADPVNERLIPVPARAKRSA
jgi:aspartyl protease family protein